MITWIAALLTSVIGFGSLVHLQIVASTWPTSLGRVIGNVKKRNHGGPNSPSTTSFFPKIEFVTGTGAVHQVCGDIGLRNPYEIGQPIKVWFKPSNPNHAMTMNRLQRFLFSGAFIAISIPLWGLILGIIDRNGFVT